MMQQALTRHNVAPSAWAMLASISAAAVLLGVIVAQGRWFLLPAIALLPLLWFWPVEVGLGLLVVTMPFEQISKLGSLPAVVTLALVLAVAVLLGVGLSHSRLSRPPGTVWWWSLFVLWTVASAMWAMQPSLSLANMAAVIAAFVFYFVASSFRIREKEFQTVVSAMIVGGAAAALVSMYEYATGMITAAHVVRATLVAGAEEGNPNRFAVRLLLPLCFAMARFLTARTGRGKTVAGVFVVIISGGLLLAMSRGALLAAAVAVLIFTLRLPHLRRRVGLVIAMAAILVAVMPRGFFVRLDSSEKDRGAGRLDIWTVGLNAFEHHAIIGAGLNNFPLAFHEFAGTAPHLSQLPADRRYNDDAHNIYLLVAVEEGAIGLLLLLIGIKSQLNLGPNYRKPLGQRNTMRVACEAGFCSILAAGFFTSIIWEKTFWLACACLAFAVVLPPAEDSAEASYARARAPQWL